MSEPSLTITLLGTGTPTPSLERFSQSTLVEAGGQRLMIDCGRGAALRVAQLGYPLGSVGPLFLTHLHSDHVVGIPDLWITGWFLRATTPRTTPFRVFGPAGTASMMHHLEQAFAVDRRVRLSYEGNAPEGIEVDAHDVDEGLVYERDGLTVSAIRVAHWKQADAPPSLGYRVEFEGRSVAFSGDTTYTPHLAEAARGADVFVHEVQLTAMTDEEEVAIRRSPDPGSRRDLIMAIHTSPREAGRAFAAAQPRLAVYSHIILPPELSEADLIAKTRETYAGPLTVGHDLMQIRVGDEIEIARVEPR